MSYEMDEEICEHEERGRYVSRQPCERRPDSNDWWICDRCGSLWSGLLHGTGWLPLACPDRSSAIKGVNE